jgi:hypothetical protein
MKKTENYDERQMQIRNKVYKRGFFVSLLLLLADGMLMRYDIMWSNQLSKYFLMFMLLVSYVDIEFIFRGAQFGKKDSRVLYAVIFGLFGSLAVAATILTPVDGEKIIEDNMLSQTGAGFVVGLLFLLLSVCTIIQIIREKRTGSDLSEEEGK